MRKFRVKGTGPEILTILNEAGNQLNVLVEKDYGFGIESREETMSKQLFESCLRTDYLTEVQTA